MNQFSLLLSVALAASLSAFAVHAQGVQGDVQAGAKKNAMCIGCHGIVGYQASFPEVHKVPKISGQSAAYIVASLNAYQKGERKHASMRGIAATLSEQDIADLAAYYQASGAVEGAPALGKAPAASEKVQALLTKGACVSCHGDAFSNPIDPTYPKIAGQYSDYLYVALKSYKVEGNPHIGRGNAIMGGVAKQFSNAELKELSNYIGTLPGELKVVPQSRFR